MGVTNKLYQLQEIDLEIESEEQTLSQKASQLGTRQALDNAQSKLASEQQRLEELRHQQHSAEWEVGDLLSKIATVEQQLYSGKITNPKELSSLQHEVSTMKAKSDQLEDEWQRQQQQLSDEIEQLKSRLADLKQKRQQLSEKIESQAVALYEKIRQNKKPPVARVEQGICRICRISLSSSALQRARSGDPVQCGSCGRILFLP